VQNRILEICRGNSDINFRNPTIGQELDLVNEFIDYKIEKFEKICYKNEDIKLAIFKEPEIGMSYPDIIFAEYNDKNIENWNNDRRNLENQDLKILYQLYIKKGLNAKEIVRQLGVTYSILMKSIERLLDAKLIERKSGTWKVIDEENFFAIKKIETIEAKLNQWNSALKQAVQNTRFSSECYVLSELKSKPNAITIDKFNELGIGMYIKNNKGFSQINKAKRNNIPNSYTSLMIGEVIGKIVNS